MVVGLLLVAGCVVLLVCGTWVAQPRVSNRDGVEVQTIVWTWQWHSSKSNVRSLGLLSVAGVVFWWAITGWRTSSVTAPHARPRTQDQRRFPRYDCAWPVQYQVRSLPFERHAVCVNISEGGMQCLMQEGWVRHTPLELRVTPPQAEPLHVQGTVVWARSVPATDPALGEGPHHRVGIRFHPEGSLPAGTLLRLLQSSGGLVGGPVR